MGTTQSGVAIPGFGTQKAVLLAGQSNAVYTVLPPLGAHGTLSRKVAQGSTGLVDWAPGSALFNQAVAAMYGLDVRELWWIQGEEDAASLGTSSVYLTRLRAMLAAFRAALGNFTARIALLHSACTRARTAEVRAAQLTACDDPGNVAFDLDGYSNYDGLHYYDPEPHATYLEIGEDLGALYTATLP
jgi:hypothetical protein